MVGRIASSRHCWPTSPARSLRGLWDLGVACVCGLMIIINPRPPPHLELGRIHRFFSVWSPWSVTVFLTKQVAGSNEEPDVGLPLV